MEKFDIAIVGSGPAGISSAITAKVRNTSFKLFGNQQISKKLQLTKLIENYPGEYNISGKELIEKYRKQLTSMNIDIVTERIINIYDMSDYFIIVSDRQQYQCDSVILACGVPFGKTIKGEKEFLGKGVSYCATCDGNFYRDRELAVYCDNEKLEEEVEYLLQLASKIYLYCPYQTKLQHEKLVVLAEPIEEIGGDFKLQKVILADKTELKVDGCFIFRNEVDPANLIGGLKMSEGHVIVDNQMATNIKGVFACGDLTGRPYQIAKALGQGNQAVLAAIEYLYKKRK
ncbi:MAG: NAD(P)/FAD-dependent oxidoreductase [Erysipelotrichaceae bacterium]